MFPTIFTLANEGLGKRAAEGSGVICLTIDLTILAFGWFARRPLNASRSRHRPL
jgi:hypothetical protein